MIKHLIRQKSGLYLFFCLIVFLTSLPSCQRDRLFKKSTILMDTVVTVTVVSDSSEKANKAIDRVFSELKRLEGLFNFYSQDSELSFINRNAGVRPVEVSKDMIDILKKALYISELTGGAFDVTTAPLTRLWDFHKKEIPPPRKIKEVLRLVNYKDIVINEEDSTIYLKRKGAMIDLGGIVKGYGVDRAVEILKTEGIKGGLVAIAGDIRGYGVKDKGSPWLIGIKNPRSEGGDDIIATLPLRDSAISTSGDYERFFIKNGRRYHHILNPKTGYPTDSSGGVSVIAEEGYLSDSIATAVFVLGPDRGQDLLKRLGLKGVLITEEGRRIIIGEIDGLKWQK